MSTTQPDSDTTYSVPFYSDEEKVEIFKAAINRAVTNGWKPTQYDVEDMKYINRTWPIIFAQHDFVKALWGEKETTGICKCGEPINKSHYVLSGAGIHGEILKSLGWEHHVCELFTTEDQMGYIARNAT